MGSPLFQVPDEEKVKDSHCTKQPEARQLKWTQNDCNVLKKKKMGFEKDGETQTILLPFPSASSILFLCHAQFSGILMARENHSVHGNVARHIFLITQVSQRCKCTWFIS